VNISHGRLTPTALGARRYARPENSAICDAQTTIHKSGGRQPAVGSGNALATATWHSSENLRAGTRSGDRQPAVAQNRIGSRNRPHTRDDRQPKQERGA
jgi:hypothetical protein